MVRLAQVTDFLQELAPLDLAQSWDSNGLICGDPDEEVKRILLAVDPVEVVVDEAIEKGAQLVITHHPLFLRGTNTVAASNFKGRVVHRLIRAGVGLYNCHTNLDAAASGVAQALADVVGLVDTRPLEADAARPKLGIGRVGHLEQPMSLQDFAYKVAAALPDSAPGLLVGGDLQAQVVKVAVSGGAGDSLLQAAREAGVDVFLTADLRHHPASEHLEGGKPYLLNATHWASEWVGLPPLAKALKQWSSQNGHDLQVEVSQLVTDPWNARISTKN
jgi:dinuclear metal center protein, YbgI family